LRFIELFAGIGGFRVGLEPLGWKSVWANEIDPYACKVYRKNFGDKELVEGDIREIDPMSIPEFDMLTGGFPCQDISQAGKREGITELNRSGLFYEIIRIVKARLPRWVFLENVSALLIQGRGMDTVLREFSACGYDVQWNIVSAASVGALHRRDRIWIVAYPNSNGEKRNKPKDRQGRGAIETSEIPNSDSIRPIHSESKEQSTEGRFDAQRNISSICGEVSNTNGERLERQWESGENENEREQFQIFNASGSERRNSDQWLVEPDVGRVVNGIPSRMDRLKCLGNAVVPQVVTHVGQQIQDYIENSS